MGFCFSCRGVRPKIYGYAGARRAKALGLAFFCLFSSTLALASNEQSTVLSLRDAIEDGIRTSPDYGIAKERKGAADAGVWQAKAGYLPKVDFTAQMARTETTTPFLSGTRRLNNTETTLAFSQLLFDGPGTVYDIKRSKFQAEAADRRVGELKELLALEIVRAYLEVLHQRSQQEIGQQNIEKHRIMLDKILAGYKAGTMNQGDVAQARSRLNTALASAAVLEQNLRTAESLFLQRAGRLPPDLILPEIPKGKLSPTVEIAVSEALAGSKTLYAAQSDVKAAKAAYTSVGSGYYPRIDLEASDSQGKNLSGAEGGNDTTEARLVARWNLWKSGADFARRQEFMHRYMEAERTYEQSQRQIEKQVRDAWAEMEASKKRTREFLEQVKANKQVVRAYLDQFTLGRRSLIDVLDAQSELFRSRLDHVSAVYTENYDVYQLLAEQGKLLETIGIDAPVLAQSDQPAKTEPVPAVKIEEKAQPKAEIQPDPSKAEPKAEVKPVEKLKNKKKKKNKKKTEPKVEAQNQEKVKTGAL